MLRSSILKFGSLPTYRYGTDPYDENKLGLGPLMVQINNAGNEGKFAGPHPIGLARPMEQSTAIASIYPWAMRWQNNADGEIDWIFLADTATAAATRRINAYTFNRRTALFTWKGFVTVTYPVATAVTIRAQRMTYDLESTGTVAVSGTAVTGTSTVWQTNKCCVGNRIGFGSTDPTLITTWYEISAIASDTGLTLSTSAGTIPSGTPFVIEDLRCVQLNTNATTTNGGIFVIKGLNFDQFSPSGGTVPAATTVDNIRAAYWLKDAVTCTHTVGIGIGMDVKTSPTSQMIYSLDTLVNPFCFKTNIRAALTLTAGADTSSFVAKTGLGGAVTGTIGQLNNGRLATMTSGPLAGVPALYFTTTTRIYGTPVSGITSGSTTWLSSGFVMNESPPGSINTFAATSALSSLEYMSTIDKFVVPTSATQRNYVTTFRTDGGQMDRIFGNNTLQIDQVAADATTTPIPSQSGGTYSIWCEGGISYIVTVGTTALINRLYAVPIGADWEYAENTNCRIITPAITTTSAKRLLQVFGQEVQVLGGATGYNLGLNTEPWRLYYRTTGISDNTGSWTLTDSSGLTDAAISGNKVQLMIEFRTIGTLMIPARICNVGVVFEDGSTSEKWQGSTNIGTDLVNKRFGFRHSTAYGTTVPTLVISLYDAETGTLLGSDDSVTQAWSWEKSTNNGGAWGAYNNTDKGNNNTYIRITPTSLADNIKVRAELTEY